MVKKEKLFQRQIDKVHADDVRAVPAPIPPQAMGAIAQDARGLMLTGTLPPPPSRGQNSDDEMSFFDKSVTEGILAKTQKPPRPIWTVLPAMLWGMIHSEFFIILLRIALIILFAVLLSYLAKLLDRSTSQCGLHTPIIYCVAWASFALIYSCLWFAIPLIRELSLLPAMRKIGILVADSVGLMLSTATTVICWLAYSSWYCGKRPLPSRIVWEGNSREVQDCGGPDACPSLKSSAIVSSIACIFWMGASIATMNQLSRRTSNNWVTPAVKSWEL